MPCLNDVVRGPSMCDVKNVAYQGSCTLCNTEHARDKSEAHKGIYIGPVEELWDHMVKLSRLSQWWINFYLEILVPPVGSSDKS